MNKIFLEKETWLIDYFYLDLKLVFVGKRNEFYKFCFIVAVVD